MTVNCIFTRDEAEALIDAACAHMARTNDNDPLYSAARVLAHYCGIKNEYIEEEIKRLKNEIAYSQKLAEDGYQYEANGLRKMLNKICGIKQGYKKTL